MNDIHEKIKKMNLEKDELVKQMFLLEEKKYEFLKEHGMESLLREKGLLKVVQVLAEEYQDYNFLAINNNSGSLFVARPHWKGMGSWWMSDLRDDTKSIKIDDIIHRMFDDWNFFDVIDLNEFRKDKNHIPDSYLGELNIGEGTTFLIKSSATWK